MGRVLHACPTSRSGTARVTLPAGSSSGRGRERLKRACPPRPEPEAPASGRGATVVAEDVSGAALSKESRKPINPMSAKRRAALGLKPGDEVHSSLAPPSEKPRKSTRATKRRASGQTRHTRKIEAWERELQEAWFLAVVERAEGRCEATGEPLIADGLTPGANVGHHVIEQSVLWAYRRQMGLTIEELVRLLWDARNGMAVNPAPHRRHDDASDWTIPASSLRDHHWEFAEHCDRLIGTEFFTSRLRRDYR